MLPHINRMHNVYVIITVYDHIAFRFVSHKNIVNIFYGSLDRKSFLSRPLQLALGFTIVPYGEYFSASENLLYT